ncbi:MAG: FAD-dependent oxidoreductase [Lautropia sp.]
MTSKAFEPIAFGGVELRNRIVLGAVSSLMEDRRGLVTDTMEAFFVRRAQGGAGLVTLGIGSVVQDVKIVKRQLGLYSDAVIPGLKRLADAVHETGSKVAVQLHHAGRLAVPDYNNGLRPKGPSSIKGKLDMFGAPDELSVDEIEAIIAAYGTATQRLAEAGVDVLEIHAAHGHGLPQQFLSPYSNCREDQWGGSVENRMRFLRRVIQEIQKHKTKTQAICLRLSADEDVEGGLTPAMSQEIVGKLKGSGIEALSISAGNYDSRRPIAVQPPSMPRIVLRDLADAIHPYASFPTGVAGRILSPADVNDVLASGIAEFVVMTRSLIADPDFPNKMAGLEKGVIRPCIGSMWCLRDVRIGRPIECSTAAEVGHEAAVGWALPYKPATGRDSKTAVVVGGGPAGMEAARVLARRGHEVHLLEAGSEVGGQLLMSTKAVTKQDHAELVRYLRSELEALGVQVQLGKRASAADVLSLEADTVLIATGSRPTGARIVQVPAAMELAAEDVLRGTAVPGTPSRVVVPSGDMIGCDVAEALALAGHQVFLLEAGSRVARDVEAFTRREQLVTRFPKLPITVMSNSSGIGWEGRRFAVKSKEEHLSLEADYVVTGIQRISENGLYEQLRHLLPEVVLIGEAARISPGLGGIHAAVQNAYETALDVLPTVWN